MVGAQLTAAWSMIDLSEFLLARIAEDEADARTALLSGAWDELWIPPPVPVQVVMRVNQHIARWGPARVLAECEAKRLLIERVGNPDWAGFRLLALPYANHEDWREEWRP